MTRGQHKQKTSQRRHTTGANFGSLERPTNLNLSHLHIDPSDYLEDWEIDEKLNESLLHDTTIPLGMQTMTEQSPKLSPQSPKYRSLPADELSEEDLENVEMELVDADDQFYE